MATHERITDYVHLRLNIDNIRKFSADLMTPPARENTEVDLNLNSDDAEESNATNVWLERDKVLVDDVPIDGHSTDQSEFSAVQADTETKSDVVAELEKAATQSEISALSQEYQPPSVSDSIATDAMYDTNDNESLDLTYSTESYTPVHERESGIPSAGRLSNRSSNRSQGRTLNTTTDLGLSTWHSSACSMCTCGAITGTFTDTSTNENIHLLAHGGAANNWIQAKREAENSTLSTTQKSAGGYVKVAEDGEDIEQSRNASRLALESREAMFQRAMTLLSTRCTSVRQGLNTVENKVPFGIQIPRYFYVNQAKPTPMEPLKAWRGYNGNVYFEPLSIAHMKGAPEFEGSPRYTDRTSDRTTDRTMDRTTDRTTDRSIDRQRSFQGQKRAVSEKGGRPVTDNRSGSRQTLKSSQSSGPSMRQAVIMDKQQLLSRFNEALQEEITWLEGQESTGSLAVRPKTQPDSSIKRDILYNKERIRKGSVVHKLYVENKTRRRPKLSVSGGKVTPPNAPSPLLRAQTQYSLSSQRLTTNSPDLYTVNDNKLPPVYQIRASLKTNSQNRAKSYNRPVTVADMKPFVKYSPDVVVKFNTHQQANMA